MNKITPAMGWNSWNTFTKAINEDLIIESAKAMVDSGLKDAGYEYIVIDDCWSLRERNEKGELVPDPEKFPHGMKYVADKVHELGLKFGMYSCAGTLTCAGFPGSYEHEFIDAKTFASWGVDYLKYDYCYHSNYVPAHILYKRMGLALANSGRDILFSACSWGHYDTHKWIRETNANSFRSTMDINDNFVSVKTLFQSQLLLQDYGGQSCFNDMDMLIVGMHGGSNDSFIGGEKSGCTNDEYFTHFALWCMFASPLMLGNDIRHMDEETLKILTNKDLIRINQDKKCNKPFYINIRPDEGDRYRECPAIAKILDDGKIAIAIANLTDGDASQWLAHFNTDALGLPESTGKTLKMRNVVTNETCVITNGHFSTQLKAHETKVYIAEIIDK